MQVSVHTPNFYLQERWPRLLPDWTTPVHSLLIVLQRCQHNLIEQTDAAEADKHDRRDRFLKISEKLIPDILSSGHRVEVFDPRTGLPLRSTAGSLKLDDVALVRATLGYATAPIGHCMVLLHPQWGSAVYPGTLVSTAPPDVLAQVVRRISL